VKEEHTELLRCKYVCGYASPAHAGGAFAGCQAVSGQRAESNSQHVYSIYDRVKFKSSFPMDTSSEGQKAGPSNGQRREQSADAEVHHSSEQAVFVVGLQQRPEGRRRVRFNLGHSQRHEDGCDYGACVTVSLAREGDAHAIFARST
jgi:hypothetical protein